MRRSVALCFAIFMLIVTACAPSDRGADQCSVASLLLSADSVVDPVYGVRDFIGRWDPSPSARSERPTQGGSALMSESVYKVIELVGTSTDSWEKAAAAAVERASQTLRDLRVAEVAELDLQIKDGKVESYRAKVKVSFKFENGDSVEG